MSNTRTALDIVWNNKKKEYQLIKIEYNYFSKKAEIQKPELLAADEHFAIYKAKEMVVKSILALKDSVGDKAQTLDQSNDEEEF